MTIIIWTKIASRSLLRPVLMATTDGRNKYTVKDKKYRTSANTVTMSKFGPSGSLKKKNIALEHTRAVMAKIINEVFFDLKYMFVIVLENSLAGCLV